MTHVAACTLLAESVTVLRVTSFSLGVVAAGLLVRARRARSARIHAERLGAATLETLLNAIDANDAITGAHVRRVASYSLILCDAMGFDERTSHSVERLALFHDIGKIHEAITDIFHEKTRLTAVERRAVMTHPQRGADVLAPLAPFYPGLPRGVLCHHERWDGSGYPRHLKGKRIPLEARVVAIADTFDAVTQSRRYSKARSVTIAKEAILEGRGTQFDPELVDLFLSPLVMKSIEESVAAMDWPRSRNHRRNGKKIDQPVPDLRFRWRTSGVARQTRDR